MQTAPMGEIAEVQLLELTLGVIAQIDVLFQIWLTITFAVLVATFFVGERLSLLGRLVVAGLYACANTVLMLRYGSAIELLEYARGIYAVYEVAAPPGGSAGAAFLRVVLMFVGSAITVLAALFPGLGFRRAEVVDRED